MNLFKRVIRWKIDLFMFMLGCAILKTAAPQRKSCTGDRKELAGVKC